MRQILSVLCTGARQKILSCWHLSDGLGFASRPPGELYPSAAPMFSRSVLCPCQLGYRMPAILMPISNRCYSMTNHRLARRGRPTRCRRCLRRSVSKVLPRHPLPAPVHRLAARRPRAYVSAVRPTDAASAFVAAADRQRHRRFDDRERRDSGQPADPRLARPSPSSHGRRQQRGRRWTSGLTASFSRSG
jgi:hypothetical protein